MSDTDPRTYTKNDRVIVNPAVARTNDRGRVYVVTKILKVNVMVEPEGGGRGMRIKPGLLLPAPTDQADTTAVTVAFEPPLWWGTVVLVDRAPTGAWRQPAGDLYVVVGDKDGGASYRLARLGGDPSGKYFRNIPRGWLTLVPVESINGDASDSTH
jgi:hypothetical protein